MLCLRIITTDQDAHLNSSTQRYMPSPQVDRDQRQQPDGSKNGSQPGVSGGKEDGQSGRGFANMSPERQREIASMGGRASGGNFANNPARAAEAGRKGGQSHAQTPSMEDEW